MINRKIFKEQIENKENQTKILFYVKDHSGALNLSSCNFADLDNTLLKLSKDFYYHSSRPYTPQRPVFYRK